ncbi:926_t:CDS:2 [Acaulospora morrowiae]|uniref:926_t:CDS:1 n=1 Tax=Acaulospora morrowiae TaxID=94023 RepID=A0A9N9EYY9_9GLOM|nr:926_t:CDS:2 [Acaulospora morrowiae]
MVNYTTAESPFSPNAVVGVLQHESDKSSSPIKDDARNDYENGINIR